MKTPCKSLQRPYSSTTYKCSERVPSTNHCATPEFRSSVRSGETATKTFSTFPNFKSNHTFWEYQQCQPPSYIARVRFSMQAYPLLSDIKIYEKKKPISRYCDLKILCTPSDQHYNESLPSENPQQSERLHRASLIISQRREGRPKLLKQLRQLSLTVTSLPLPHFAFICFVLWSTVLIW